MAIADGPAPEGSKKLSSRELYLGLLGSQIVFAVAAGGAALAGFNTIALAFIALTLAISPVFAHARMRRALAAVTRLHGNSGQGGAAVFDSGLATRLSALESSLGQLNHKIDTLDAKQSGNATDEASRYANEIRREARALRLMLHELRSE